MQQPRIYERTYQKQWKEPRGYALAILTNRCERSEVVQARSWLMEERKLSTRWSRSLALCSLLAILIASLLYQSLIAWEWIGGAESSVQHRTLECARLPATEEGDGANKRGWIAPELWLRTGAKEVDSRATIWKRKMESRRKGNLRPQDHPSASDAFRLCNMHLMLSSIFFAHDLFFVVNLRIKLTYPTEMYSIKTEQGNKKKTLNYILWQSCQW